MSLSITAYSNCDDAYIVWRLKEKLNNCLGFALYRKWLNGKNAGTVENVHNRIGFEDDPGEPFMHKPSSEWPFQRFTWSDHDVQTGDKVSYRVVPVMKTGTTLAEDQSQASSWTSTVTLSPDAGTKASCYFNRGFVISQFMARELGKITPAKLKEFKKSVSDNMESKIRQFLSGELRIKLVSLLEAAKANDGSVFAALYELDDNELIARLVALGKKANVVLANGSVKKKGEDQNSEGRQQLNVAGVNVFDRMVSPGPLGHNKFLVICDRKGNPVSVWTGSTNWTTTGLCTQINNGLLIEDVEIAQFFLDQWNRLKSSGSTFPENLVTPNSELKQDTINKAKVGIWFTRTGDQQDLNYVRERINGAKDGILFLMFQPGAAALLGDIFQRLSPVSPTFDKNLYIHGVVSTITEADNAKIHVGLVGNDQHSQNTFDPVIPQGITHPFANWAAEVSRGEFLSNIGFAIVHSKVLIIDPFGKKPVVVTGSHNLSMNASTKNDENIVVIEGNSKLAQAYAVNAISVYNHYRWRAYLQTAKKPFKGLKREDTWQDGEFRPTKQKELSFWLPTV